MAAAALEKENCTVLLQYARMAAACDAPASPAARPRRHSRRASGDDGVFEALRALARFAPPAAGAAAAGPGRRPAHDDGGGGGGGGESLLKAYAALDSSLPGSACAPPPRRGAAAPPASAAEALELLTKLSPARTGAPLAAPPQRSPRAALRELRRGGGQPAGGGGGDAAYVMRQLADMAPRRVRWQ